jgi:hypothetical protein
VAEWGWVPVPSTTLTAKREEEPTGSEDAAYDLLHTFHIVKVPEGLLKSVSGTNKNELCEDAR